MVQSKEERRRKMREYMRLRRETDKEHMRAITLASHLRHIEKRRIESKERMRLKRAENPELFAARSLAYYHTHKEEVAAKKKAAYAARTDEQKERDRTKSREAMRRWLKKPENVEKHRATARKHTVEGAHRRRARMRQVEIGDIDYREISMRTMGCCGICGGQVEPNFEYDHIIPLSRGGPHTTDNIQLAHRFCNRSKHAKLVA